MAEIKPRTLAMPVNYEVPWTTLIDAGSYVQGWHVDEIVVDKINFHTPGFLRGGKILALEGVPLFKPLWPEDAKEFVCYDDRRLANVPELLTVGFNLPGLQLEYALVIELSSLWVNRRTDKMLALYLATRNRKRVLGFWDFEKKLPTGSLILTAPPLSFH